MLSSNGVWGDVCGCGVMCVGVGVMCVGVGVMCVGVRVMFVGAWSTVRCSCSLLCPYPTGLSLEDLKINSAEGSDHCIGQVSVLDTRLY